MAFVKGFDINGINTIQTACIELQGRPNAATEGAVGLLAIDMSSHTKDVYKCVKVEGAIYTWELLSSGMSILNSSESGNGIATATFTYSAIRMTDKYVVKVGDLILDSKGYLYRITRLNNTYCEAEYCNLFINRDGVGISEVEQGLISDASGTVNKITIKLTDGSEYSFNVKNGQTAYELAVANGYEGTEKEWLDNLGYGSWLKGRVVTQAEYDALSPEEKDKPGYMYVVKDAPVKVEHATTADRATNANHATEASSLKLTDSYTAVLESGTNQFTEVTLTQGKYYLMRVDIVSDVQNNYYIVPILTPLVENTSAVSAYFGYKSSYYCRLTYYQGVYRVRIRQVNDETSGIAGTVKFIPIGSIPNNEV
jgi:hypothetical protein